MTKKLIIGLSLVAVVLLAIYFIQKGAEIGGTTLLIVVEQNVRFALHYAGRGYILGNGEVRFTGRVEELSDPRKMHEAFLM